jgi:hypothetical protein
MISSETNFRQHKCGNTWPIQIFTEYLAITELVKHFNAFMAVFLNRRAAARYWALVSIITGPSLIGKRIYRAAV